MNAGARMSDRRLMAVEVGASITENESHWVSAFLSAIHGADFSLGSLRPVPARIAGVLAAIGFTPGYGVPLISGAREESDPMQFVKELVDRIAPKEGWRRDAGDDDGDRGE